MADRLAGIAITFTSQYENPGLLEATQLPPQTMTSSRCCDDLELAVVDNAIEASQSNMMRSSGSIALTHVHVGVVIVIKGGIGRPVRGNSGIASKDLRSPNLKIILSFRFEDSNPLRAWCND